MSAHWSGFCRRISTMSAAQSCHTTRYIVARSTSSDVFSPRNLVNIPRIEQLRIDQEILQTAEIVAFRKNFDLSLGESITQTQERRGDSPYPQADAPNHAHNKYETFYQADNGQCLNE